MKIRQLSTKILMKTFIQRKFVKAVLKMMFHVTKSSQALAEHFCETCDEKICTQCKLAHKRLKISRNHKINPLHNFINKNRVTAAKTVEELEESFANLSIRDESLPW